MIYNTLTKLNQRLSKKREMHKKKVLKIFGNLKIKKKKNIIKKKYFSFRIELLLLLKPYCFFKRFPIENRLKIINAKFNLL